MLKAFSVWLSWFKSFVVLDSLNEMKPLWKIKCSMLLTKTVSHMNDVYDNSFSAPVRTYFV